MDMLKIVEDLADQFRQKAQLIDAGKRPPVEHLQQLASIGYYRFVVLAEPGQKRRASDLLSSGCGVTAFLSTQHEGVCRRLHAAGHPHTELALKGERFIGVCFAHLRRSPSPVDAIAFRDQVVFSGSGPWFSGYGVMEEVVVGGAQSKEEFVMGLAPMSAPEIAVKQLPELAVMNATATVSLNFNALVVESTDIVVRMTAEELQEKDMHSTVFQASRSLGVARAAAIFLPRHAREAALGLLESQHLKMDKWDQSPNWPQATTLRREALSLAGQVIEAAYVNEGGKAHLSTHPLGRIAREANFYSTSQLTKPLRDAVTEELTDKLATK